MKVFGGYIGTGMKRSILEIQWNAMKYNEMQWNTMKCNEELWNNRNYWF